MLKVVSYLNCIVVPDTGLKLYDGTIVILARFPDVKWIVHNGWYNYQGSQYMGWYFCSIPAQTILPVNDEDLRLLTVVTEDGGPSCPSESYPPYYPGCHPGPVGPPGPGCCPPPPGHHIPDWMKRELERAYITVETIAERDYLNQKLLPNGKLVRVNNVAGVVKYYAWNQVTQVWDEVNMAPDLSNYLTTEEGDVRYVKSEDFTAKVSDEVAKQIDEYNIPQKIEDVIESSETVHTIISDIITDVAPGIIEEHTQDLRDSIATLNTDVKSIKNDLEWKHINDTGEGV